MGIVNPAKALKGRTQPIDEVFCKLSAAELADLQSMMHSIFYGCGSVLFLKDARLGPSTFCSMAKSGSLFARMMTNGQPTV